LLNLQPSVFAFIIASAQKGFVQRASLPTAISTGRAIFSWKDMFLTVFLQNLICPLIVTKFTLKIGEKNQDETHFKKNRGDSNLSSNAINCRSCLQLPAHRWRS
jgi:hypothetical protein